MAESEDITELEATFTKLSTPPTQPVEQKKAHHLFGRRKIEQPKETMEKHPIQVFHASMNPEAPKQKNSYFRDNLGWFVSAILGGVIIGTYATILLKII